MKKIFTIAIIVGMLPSCVRMVYNAPQSEKLNIVGKKTEIASSTELRNRFKYSIAKSFLNNAKNTLIFDTLNNKALLLVEKDWKIESKVDNDSMGFKTKVVYYLDVEFKENFYIYRYSTMYQANPDVLQSTTQMSREEVESRKGELINKLRSDFRAQFQEEEVKQLEWYMSLPYLHTEFKE